MVASRAWLQFRAVYHKSRALQGRQWKTNIAIIVLVGFVLLGATMMLVMGPSEAGSYYEPPSTFDALENGHWNCINKTDGIVGRCGVWNRIAFSNPQVEPSDRAGFLRNNSQGYGMLGNIRQSLYTSSFIEESGAEPPFIFVPFFDEYPSPDAIEQEFSQLQQTMRNDTSEALEYAMPTGAINFAELNYSNRSAGLALKYEIEFGSWYTIPPNAIRDRQSLASMFISFIDGAFISSILGREDPITISVATTSFAYNRAGSSFIASIFIAYTLFVMGVLLPVFVYTLVIEKENRVLILMQIMGLKPWAYRLAMATQFYILYLVLAVVWLSFLTVATSLVTIHNFVLWVLLFLMFGMAFIAFSFLYASLFSRVIVAIVLAYIIMIEAAQLSYMLDSYPPYASGAFYYLLLLNPYYAFQRGMQSLCWSMVSPLYDTTSISTLWHLGSPFMEVMYAFVIQVVLFMSVAVYLERVLPGDVGIGSAWSYPFQWLKARCCSWRRGGEDGTGSKIENAPLVIESDFGGDSSLESSTDLDEQLGTDIAQERVNASSGDDAQFPVRIDHLEKVYTSNSSAPIKALDKLCLALRPNECFGLLGPNGAGKTTLLSILCGMFEPTSGTASINGFEVPAQMDRVYQSMGYCPQHDILWEELTVREHLTFFARLKFAPVDQEEAFVAALLDRVDMGEHADKQVSALSGGMKRRLSLAIALSGSPHVVLLDEPTTGLDPSVRQTVWQAIAQAKESGTSFMVATHNMEEADLLCDRIGILANGALQCVGAPLELKHRYASALKLSVSLLPSIADDGLSASERERRLDEWVASRFTSASLSRSFSLVREYRIPIEQAADGSRQDVEIDEVFAAMEEHKQQLSIGEWSISQASLEDVFLSIIGEDSVTVQESH